MGAKGSSNGNVTKATALPVIQVDGVQLTAFENNTLDLCTRVFEYVAQPLPGKREGNDEATQQLTSGVFEGRVQAYLKMGEVLLDLIGRQNQELARLMEWPVQTGLYREVLSSLWTAASTTLAHATERFADAQRRLAKPGFVGGAVLSDALGLAEQSLVTNLRHALAYAHVMCTIREGVKHAASTHASQAATQRRRVSAQGMTLASLDDGRVGEMDAGLGRIVNREIQQTVAELNAYYETIPAKHRDKAGIDFHRTLLVILTTQTQKSYRLISHRHEIAPVAAGAGAAVYTHTRRVVRSVSASSAAEGSGAPPGMRHSRSASDVSAQRTRNRADTPANPPRPIPQNLQRSLQKREFRRSSTQTKKTKKTKPTAGSDADSNSDNSVNVVQ